MGDQTEKLEGERKMTILVEGEEILSGGKCLDITWSYLLNELRVGGLVEEDQILNQVDVHENGIRLVIGEVKEETSNIIV